MVIDTPSNSPSATLIKEKIDDHLLSLGFTKTCEGYSVDEDVSKQKVRDLHATQRLGILKYNQFFVEKYGPELLGQFASGEQVNPALIDPELVEVHSRTPEANLFRLASLLWSVPVSQGFGRRLRFLVRDRQNGCLIGLFALGDPVFNLSARDNWVGWSFQDRCERLTHVMDAYVVGAVPPYSQIIGGKLVASLLASKEVQDAYNRKYLGRESIISKKKNRAKLVLITTTSALGRSSLYNRLSIPGGPQFNRIGTTKGFGHFQLSGGMFEILRSHLEAIEHPYASGNRFGNGANWKIRVARAALQNVGIDANSILKHGIGREVYAVPLANNWQEILTGKQKRVRPQCLSTAEISQYCLERWIVPRTERDSTYKNFKNQTIIDCLLNGGPGPTW